MFEYFILFVFAFSLWLVAFWQITQVRFKKPYYRTLTLVGVILFPVLGPLVFFVLKKKLSTERRRGFKPSFGSANN